MISAAIILPRGRDRHACRRRQTGRQTHRQTQSEKRKANWSIMTYRRRRRQDSQPEINNKLVRGRNRPDEAPHSPSNVGSGRSNAFTRWCFFLAWLPCRSSGTREKAGRRQVVFIAPMCSFHCLLCAAVKEKTTLMVARCWLSTCHLQ